MLTGVKILFLAMRDPGDGGGGNQYYNPVSLYFEADQKPAMKG